MESFIEVRSWESAQAIVKELSENGYQVLVISLKTHPEDETEYFRIEFVHPDYTGYFEKVDTAADEWDELKAESTSETVSDGLEHIEEEKVVKVKKGKK